MSAATTEAVKLTEADLARLNDRHRHAGCLVCYPDGSMEVGQTFRALCGVIAVAQSRGTTIQPTNACPDCLAHGSPWCDEHDWSGGWLA